MSLKVGAYLSNAKEALNEENEEFSHVNMHQFTSKVKGVKIFTKILPFQDETYQNWMRQHLAI